VVVSIGTLCGNLKVEDTDILDISPLCQSNEGLSETSVSSTC